MRNILVVDTSPSLTEGLQAYRAAKARTDPWWHREQAEASESKRDSYSALFHRAWQLKSQPNDTFVAYRLHTAHTKWLAEFELRGKESVSDNNPLAEDLLSSVVREALKMPMGTEVLAADAKALNHTFWEAVTSRNNESPEQIELFELAVTQHPGGAILNTLGVAYYRLGRFEDAIVTLTKSLPLNMTGVDKSVPSPADTAFLALSCLKLGNKDEAVKYRAMFVDAMRIEANSKNKDYQSFQREIEEAFGP